MESRSQQRRARAWALGAIATLAAISVVDAATPDKVILVPILVAGPLVAAFGASPAATARISVLAILLAVGLGKPSTASSARARQAIQVTAIAIGGALATALASVRERLQDAERPRVALSSPRAGRRTRARRGGAARPCSHARASCSPPAWTRRRPSSE